MKKAKQKRWRRRRKRGGRGEQKEGEEESPRQSTEEGKRVLGKARKRGRGGRGQERGLAEGMAGLCEEGEAFLERHLLVTALRHALQHPHQPLVVLLDDPLLRTERQRRGLSSDCNVMAGTWLPGPG